MLRSQWQAKVVLRRVKRRSNPRIGRTLLNAYCDLSSASYSRASDELVGVNWVVDWSRILSEEFQAMAVESESIW